MIWKDYVKYIINNYKDNVSDLDDRIANDIRLEKWKTDIND
ncbi:hypothetical protein [Candidatus Galacturonibacter soehngenii]|nr:hypothetical protein [Candidatus Galacturonibacter soehngenii]